MRSETKTNCTLRARFFLRFEQVTGNLLWILIVYRAVCSLCDSPNYSLSYWFLDRHSKSAHNNKSVISWRKMFSWRRHEIPLPLKDNLGQSQMELNPTPLSTVSKQLMNSRQNAPLPHIWFKRRNSFSIYFVQDYRLSWHLSFCAASTEYCAPFQRAVRVIEIQKIWEFRPISLTFSYWN